MNKLERILQHARNEMLAERFGRIERRKDKSVVPGRPMRDRPPMPDVAEFAGEHQGERPCGDE